MSYRLSNSAKVSRELSDTAYAAWELLGNVNGATLSPDDARKLVKTRDALMTHSAGAYVPKVPADVLAALQWVQLAAQERATENDFNTAREALAEHDALRFVTDWLEASGVDVLNIRAAELRREAREEYQEKAAREEEAANAPPPLRYPDPDAMSGGACLDAATEARVSIYNAQGGTFYTLPGSSVEVGAFTGAYAAARAALHDLNAQA